MQWSLLVAVEDVPTARTATFWLEGWRGNIFEGLAKNVNKKLIFE
jgi:hypothetical protein